jgi:hypothetical protein
VSFSGVGGSNWDLLLGSDNAQLGLNASVFLNVYAQAIGNYSITVVGTSGSLSHAVSLHLIAQDVGFSFNPPSLAIQQGTSLVTSLSLTSRNGFTGNVSLNAVSNLPDWFLFKVSMSPSVIFVPPRATVTSSVVMSAADFTPPGSATVSVHATFGSQGWVTPIPVQITQAPEPLSLLSYVFNSNSNATLWIRNDGPLPVLVNRYNVTDGLGNTYYWCLQSFVNCGSNPLQINSTSIGGLNVLVGTNCSTSSSSPRCTVYGSQFIFQTGHSYNVNVWTTRNNMFTFTIKT